MLNNLLLFSRSVAKHPEVGVGIIGINGKDMLLLKSDKWHDRYILPCGHVEFGEPSAKAAKREFKEETGILITGLQFLCIDELITSKEFHDKNRHFVCLEYFGCARSRRVTLDNEAQSYLWTSPKAALALNLDSVSRRAIQTYLARYNGRNTHG